jgi:hypothetical protein
MKPRILLRVAAFFTLFVAVGHTVGHFTRKITTDQTDKEVIRQMETHKFYFYGFMRSWDNFYEGLGLDVSITLLILTVLLWIIGNSTHRYPLFCFKLLWPVLICFIGFTITGFLYFFLVPAICTLVASVLVMMAMLQLRRQVSIKNVL